MKPTNFNNLQLYKNKISEHINKIVESSDSSDINNFFSDKHKYLIKFKPYNATVYPNFGYLKNVRMYTESDAYHLTLDTWISKTRTLSIATMKSTNTENSEVFDLKISTPAVYTDTDNYQTYRSWLDGGLATTGTWPTVGNTVDYEFDCVGLSRIEFTVTGNDYNRYCKNCDVTVYVDGIEKCTKSIGNLVYFDHINIKFDKNSVKVEDVYVQK